MKHIYLDHAAATPLDPEVREAMLPFLDSQQGYGNPSSFHTMGKQAKDALEASRKKIADLLGASHEEIFFTSGGTESNNLAILGFARAYKEQGDHLVTSEIEHHAVLEPMMFLQNKEGFDLTKLSVDKHGMFSVQEAQQALTPHTLLVSLMAANNEIGTREPIEEIGNCIQKYRQQQKQLFPVFHTDACQAAGAFSLNVQKLHVDLLTLNASKIYGPKGIGVLYVKKGIKLQPLQFGGSQEKSRRSGTENVAAAVGFAKAFEKIQKEKDKENKRLILLRDKLIEGILTTVPKTRLNGHPTNRLPNNANISFLDIEGEALVLYLDAKGIFVSTGSACASASLQPSHVILALGLPYEVAHGSIRFTLGKSTTEKDIDYVLNTLPPLVEKLRIMSPISVDEKYYK